MSLHTQRNLESFLKTLGIARPQVHEGAMNFCLEGHQLHLEPTGNCLSMLIMTHIIPDEAQIVSLWESLIPERFGGYLVRPLWLKKGIALQITLPEVLQAEYLIRIYRALLSALSPYGVLK